MRAYKLIATFFGIGYIGRGAGSIAALIVCVLLYPGVHFHFHTGSWLLLLSCFIMAVGTLASAKVEAGWGKDSSRVVIDEVLGMAVSMLYLPLNVTTLITAFILFRFFDIAKPLGIRLAERLPGGWGVMTDDLAAGIYTNLILQFTIYIFNP